MVETTLAANWVRPAQGQWTYEDYLHLPDDGKRYEIIDGVLYVSNAPNSDHQFTITELSRQLGNFVIPQKLGRVLVVPFEVQLDETSRLVQPDAQGEYALLGEFAGNELIQSVVFAGMNLVTSTLFE